MRSWGLLALGLGIALLAVWVLVSEGSPPLDDIDAESRAQLERVLREADR